MSTLIGDKGYDGDGFRAEIVNRGAKLVIPNKIQQGDPPQIQQTRRQKAQRYRRCFRRQKDFRRVAIGYGKLARNF
ncbi:hypothetical protein [Bradyrhizobium elkanii]|uniref:hypothetical protein n=1 Tax=Bradyrhizobium elkanii TaxID=29448 RepID=UPI0004158FFA